MKDPWNNLKQYLIAHTGLAYYKDRDEQLRRALEPRMLAVEASDFGDFLDHLHNHPAEVERIVARLTVGETYFFRDRSQFQAIVEVVFPDLIARIGGRKPKVWSAGCSIGAEPYSLACLAWSHPGGLLHPLSILATDINVEALELARSRRFSEWALRDVSPQERELYFELDADAGWALRARFAQGIHFEHHNLVTDPIPPRGELYDLIVCRNVLIYFEPNCIQDLLHQFYRALRPGGWLLVGYSEPNMEMFRQFEAVRRPGTILYRRPTGVIANPILPPLAKSKTPEPIPSSCQSVATNARPLQRSSDLGQLKALADSGKWVEARELSERLLHQDPLLARVHFYRALVQEHLGGFHDSDHSFRQALYLDRKDPLIHYYRGLTQLRQGVRSEATKSFRTVIRLLESWDPITPVSDLEGISASELRALALQHIERSAE